MITLEILLDHESFESFDEKHKKLIADAATEAVLFDGRIKEAEISISIVTRDEIQRLNKKYRGLDSVTDVLSFPLLKTVLPNRTDVVPLGDVIICLERAQDQAVQYRHSVERELAFLTVHGTLHLLGYDHIEKADEDAMFSAQKLIMRNISYPESGEKPKKRAGAGIPIKKILAESKYRFIIYGAITGLILGGLVYGIGSLLLRSPEDATTTSSEQPAGFIPLVPQETEKVDDTGESLESKALSRLTGLYIDEAAAQRRPFAITINNMHHALPQSGLSQAGIVYAVLAEGGITRLVGIFDDFNSAKIGPVRSARDYFLSFSFDHSAIYVHHGESPKAIQMIRDLGVNNLNGMQLEGVTFFRDPERYAIPSMKEHSSYTDTGKLLEAAKRYETELPEGYIGLFDFYAEPTAPKGDSAREITVPFSASYPITFKYDENTKQYSVFERKNEQIDAETGEQLKTTNIIIQLTTLYAIPGDTAGRLNVTTTGSGTGYVITNGAYAPITWQKSKLTGQTQYFDEDGSRLKVNCGKTWICVHNSSSQGLAFDGFAR